MNHRPTNFTRTLKQLYRLATLAGTLVLGSTMLQAATYTDVVTADNPIGWWRFDDASTNNGQTAANSGSGTGINGTYQGGVTTTTAGLPAGLSTAAVFNGTSSHLDLGFNLRDALNGAGAVTLETWVKVAAFPDSGSNDFIFANQIEGDGTGFRLAVNPSDPRMNLGGRSDVPQNDAFKSGGANYSGTTDEWHHVVGVMDYTNDEIRLYVDKALTTTIADFSSGTYTAGSTNTIADTIGARLLSDGGLERFFDGQLAEVAVYNYALGADRIAVHYDTAIIPEPAFATLLTACLVFALTLRRRHHR